MNGVAADSRGAAVTRMSASPASRHEFAEGVAAGAAAAPRAVAGIGAAFGAGAGDAFVAYGAVAAQALFGGLDGRRAWRVGGGRSVIAHGRRLYQRAERA